MIWAVVILNATAGAGALLSLLSPNAADAGSCLSAMSSRSAAFLYFLICTCTCAVMFLSRPSPGRLGVAVLALLGHLLVVGFAVSTLVRWRTAFFSADHALSQVVAVLASISIAAIVARLLRSGLREAA